jgi:hypothetical protein
MEHNRSLREALSLETEGKYFQAAQAYRYTLDHMPVDAPEGEVSILEDGLGKGIFMA